MIEVVDLPPNWGLLWVEGARVRVLAGADPSRTYWPEETDVWRWNKGSAEASLMFSALIRVKNAVGSKEFQSLTHTMLNKSFKQERSLESPTKVARKESLAV